MKPPRWFPCLNFWLHAVWKFFHSCANWAPFRIHWTHSKNAYRFSWNKTWCVSTRSWYSDRQQGLVTTSNLSCESNQQAAFIQGHFCISCRSFRSLSRPISTIVFGTSWTTLFLPSTSCTNSSSMPVWVLYCKRHGQDRTCRFITRSTVSCVRDLPLRQMQSFRMNSIQWCSG